MIPMFLLFMILLVLFASSAFNFIAKYFYSHCKLVFGTLYPAYSSYKAIKKKDAREHSRWMMYWVCYGIFNATEFFSDILIAFWFPFYYEFKIFFILWLMSPYGNGAKVFYKTVIHPELNKREEIIDSYINKATIFSFTGINHLWRNFSAPLHNALAYGITQVLNSDGLKEISKDIGNEIEIEEVIENGKKTAKEIIEIDMDAGKENIQENVKEPVKEPVKENIRLRPRRERKATTKQF